MSHDTAVGDTGNSGERGSSDAPTVGHTGESVDDSACVLAMPARRDGETPLAILMRRLRTEAVFRERMARNVWCSRHAPDGRLQCDWADYDALSEAEKTAWVATWMAEKEAEWQQPPLSTEFR